jgi:hypothetical protein
MEVRSIRGGLGVGDRRREVNSLADGVSLPGQRAQLDLYCVLMGP